MKAPKLPAGPRLKTPIRDHVVTFRLSKRERAALDKLATRQKMPPTTLVREILLSVLETP